MKRKYFGTDGIRGEYGASILTDRFARRLGQAISQWITDREANPRIVIGRDTRQSGTALLDAFSQGLQVSGGVQVTDLGIIPTPAVSVYTRNVKASLGVMITASHNPAKDNGIKFFTSQGLKLTDDAESEVEFILENIREPDTYEAAELERAADSTAGYLDLLQPVLQGHSLEQLKIVLDLANGATFETSPALLNYFGAELIVTGNSPNGLNINAGVGSQFPENLSNLVLEHGADLGIAHDGDGDRVLFCDENGEVVDGDVLLCILALFALKSDQLARNTLVATMQSNLGLDKAMRNAGGDLVRTAIGDRHVLSEMMRSGYNLGGENSGHIIFSEINPTGDGLLAALKLLNIMLVEQKPLSELTTCMSLLPQRTGAVMVAQKTPLESLEEVQKVLRQLESEMGTEGRVLLRYSGTEPKIRLLIEGENAEKVDDWYQILEYEIKNQLT